MIKLFCSGMLAVLLFSSCGWNGTPTRGPVGIIPLTSIVIVPVSSKIAQGTSTKLTATGYYAGVPGDVTDQVVWSSDNIAVAKFNTASDKNRVSGISAGTAVITATVGNVSATYTLQVTNATVTSANMVISPINPSVHKGSTTQFTVVGTFSDNTSQDLTYDATWSPTAGTNAKVSNDPASKGLASALAEGTETITASFDNILPTPTAFTTTTLTVTPAVLQSIAVTPANSSISGTSKTQQFTATGAYSDGTTNVITSTVTWASSLTNIATITTGGLATTVAVGTTSISATLEGLSGKTNLAVTALALNSKGLQMTPESPVLGVGTTQQMTVTATFIDNSTQNVTTSCIWGSNAPVVATVNTTGLVAGDSSGIASITATCLGQTVATVVTVN